MVFNVDRRHVKDVFASYVADYDTSDRLHLFCLWTCVPGKLPAGNEAGIS